MKCVRIGFDIGGTFTEVVLHDEASGSTRLHKSLTTPADPSVGALESLCSSRRQVTFLVLPFLAIAAFEPWLVPFPDDATGAVNLKSRLTPPSATHWFGTDEMGGDILSRVVIGTRLSLWIGLTITGIAIAIGVPLGIVANYVGGWTRIAIMRFTHGFLSVPGLVLALDMVAAWVPVSLKPRGDGRAQAAHRPEHHCR